MVPMEHKDRKVLRVILIRRERQENRVPREILDHRG
jgi:hypothetical protein